MMAESKRKEASRKYYEKHKDEIRQKRQESRAKRNATTHAWREKVGRKIAEIKESSPCVDCNEFHPYYVMDFDHICEPHEKLANIAKLVSNYRSWEIIQAEIEKCEIVCANCHRKRTHTRMNVIAE